MIPDEYSIYFQLLPDGPLIVWGHVFFVIIPLMAPGAFIVGIYFAIVSEILHLRNKRRRFKKVCLVFCEPFIGMCLLLSYVLVIKPCTLYSFSGICTVL